MINFKKIASTILALGVVANLSVSAFAVGDTSPYGGGELKEYKTIQQQREEYMSRTDKTIEEKQAANAHFDKLEKLQHGEYANTQNARATTQKLLAMTVYAQEESYYCGPATLKQTTQYLNGKSESQSTIATTVGTTSKNGTEVSKMVDYLISNTTNAYADLWWYKDKASFVDTIKSSIDDGIPVVLHMSTDSTYVGGTNEWYYTTDGHYMNIRGYKKSGDLIAVADPYGYEGGGVESGKYDVSASVVYDTKTYLIV